MSQIQVANRAHGGAVQIVKRLLGEAPGIDFDTDLEMIEAYARYVNCDVALELAGDRLWLWSIKVVRA